MGPLKAKQIPVHVVGRDDIPALHRGDFVRELFNDAPQRCIAAVLAEKRISVPHNQCQGHFQYYHSVPVGESQAISLSRYVIYDLLQVVNLREL